MSLKSSSCCNKIKGKAKGRTGDIEVNIEVTLAKMSTRKRPTFLRDSTLHISAPL